MKSLVTNLVLWIYRRGTKSPVAWPRPARKKLIQISAATEFNRKAGRENIHYLVKSMVNFRPYDKNIPRAGRSAPERVNVVLGIYKHYPGSLQSSLKTILHRRHFPLGGHVTTATRETTSNGGILLRCWVMFGLVKHTMGIVLVTK
jgi:hypothetical protein